MVNMLCPDDLCVLPAGHPGTPKNEHLLGTMYGSAYEDLKKALKYRKPMSRRAMPMAPPGTSVEDLWRMGWEMRRDSEVECE